MLLPGKDAFLPALLCAVAAVTVSAQEDPLAAKSRAANQMLQAGRYTEAIKIYRELVTALPDNPGLRFNLGLALEKSGQPAAAIPELNRATRAQPDFAPAWFLLGLAYQQLGKTDEAKAAMDKGRELRPGSTVRNVPTPTKNSSPLYIEASERIMKSMAAAGLPER